MDRGFVFAVACALAACGSSSQPQPPAPTPAPSARAASPTMVSTRPPATAPAPTATPHWDVVLGESSWGTENAAGTPASARDHVLMDALGAALGGDSAQWCKTGGECWVEVRDVACDGARATCTANGAADTVDPQSPVAIAASGDKVRALLAELDARAWCAGARCDLAAIACFSNRHDELSDRSGSHQTYTCEVQVTASAPAATAAAPVAHGRRDLSALGVPFSVEASPELDAYAPDGQKGRVVIGSDGLTVQLSVWAAAAGPCTLDEVPAGATIDRRDDHGDPRVLAFHVGAVSSGTVCDAAHGTRCSFDASTPTGAAQGLAICLSVQRAP